MDAPRTFHLHMISDATRRNAGGRSPRRCGCNIRKPAPSSHIHPLVRSKTRARARAQGRRSQSGHGALHHRQSGALPSISSRTCKKAERSLRPSAEKHPASVRNPISAPPSTHRRSPASTCSMPIISGASRLSTSPCCMTTAICRRNLDDADILLIGISRTSKTPTSIYLANRGYKTANVPLIPGVPLPAEARRRATKRLCRGAGGECRAHLASPPEPACWSMPPRISTPMSIARRSPPKIAETRAALRQAGLAGDRRDTPLHRGNRRCHPCASITDRGAPVLE